MHKHTDDMPKDVKGVWIIGIGIGIGAVISTLGIFLLIALVAFPQLLIVIGGLAVLAIGGYIAQKRH